jgi:hypothetical protein
MPLLCSWTTFRGAQHPEFDKNSENPIVPQADNLVQQRQVSTMIRHGDNHGLLCSMREFPDRDTVCGHLVMLNVSDSRFEVQLVAFTIAYSIFDSPSSGVHN